MDCLVEIYDYEQINNLIMILSLKPKKSVIIYDKKFANIKDLEHIELCCKAKLPDMEFECICTNSLSIDDIQHTCLSVIHKNSDCYFDITGGGELGAIGAYLACKKTFTPIFKVDMHAGRVINILACTELEKNFSMTKLTIDTIFLSHGASIAGNNHPPPAPDMFDNILEFCRVVFDNMPQFKELCHYLQVGNSSYHQNSKSISFMAPKSISTPRNKAIFSHPFLLKTAEKLKLIYNLNLSGNTVSFFFRDNRIKHYMLDIGTWLELYCYIMLKTCNLFHDIRVSVKIDWNMGKNKQMEITNEIDITFFYGIQPCFLSCKISEPPSEALQELSMYQSYFGGRNSKCILVILSTINKEKSYIHRRASDMNIALIDGSIIHKGRFIDAIKEALKIS